VAAWNAAMADEHHIALAHRPALRIDRRSENDIVLVQQRHKQ